MFQTKKERFETKVNAEGVNTAAFKNCLRVLLVDL